MCACYVTLPQVFLQLLMMYHGDCCIRSEITPLLARNL